MAVGQQRDFNAWRTAVKTHALSGTASDSSCRASSRVTHDRVDTLDSAITVASRFVCNFAFVVMLASGSSGAAQDQAALVLEPGQQSADGSGTTVGAQIDNVTSVFSSRQATVVKLFGAASGTLDAYGSGVLVSADGNVLTVWNHLVSTGYLTAVTSDGQRHSVTIVGTSVDHDVALLKLDAKPGQEFPHVDLAQSVDVKIGSSVLAFSNMYRVAAGNEPVSVVHGVIAASVPLDATQGRWKFPVKSPVWLIDAITNNSGAAGGLLTDSTGRPIGLIGREIRHTGSSTWVNYAVPLTTLRPVVETLQAGRRIESQSTTGDAAAAMLSDQELTARFGLTLVPNVLERTPAYLDAVTLNSAAANAGLRRGDLIVLVNDDFVTSIHDLQRLLAVSRPGQQLTLTVDRGGQLLPVQVAVP